MCVPVVGTDKMRQQSMTDGFLCYAFTEEPSAREDTTVKDEGEEDAVDEDQKDEQTEAVAVEVTSEQPRSLGMERVQPTPHSSPAIRHSSRLRP